MEQFKQGSITPNAIDHDTKETMACDINQNNFASILRILCMFTFLMYKNVYLFFFVSLYFIKI